MKRWAIAAIAGTLACTDGRPPESTEVIRDVVPTDLQAGKGDEELRDPPLILARGQAPVGTLSEVVLDPAAQAALTLDTAGGVLLWPALAADSPDDANTWPITLPLQEPLWLSFAKTGSTYADGSFLLATIDTANALQVFEVASILDKPAPVWQLERRFALWPSDPILEAHVLAGGERIVALGEDHRIRVYDPSGKIVSELSQPGFVPWQLRVGATDPTGRTGMIAVLSQPLRVQPITLTGDALSLAGDARTLELDRGPNRNDLELSPDGRTLAALRRAHGKGLLWSVELIDLETDARKLVGGKVDVTVRSRMHFVDDGRLLLETGSGSGYWVDLSKAEPLPKPADADPESKFAKKLAARQAGEHPKVPLAGATEILWGLPDDDKGWRFQSTTAVGVRAAIDSRGVLILDPLDSPTHLELGFRRPALGKVALTSDWVALVGSQDGREDQLIVRELTEIGAPKQQIWPLGGQVVTLAFVDADTLVCVIQGAVDQPMTIHLYRQDSDAWTQTIVPLSALSGAPYSASAVIRPAAATASVGLSSADQRLLIDVDLATNTVESRAFALADHAAWPELLTVAELNATSEFDEAGFRLSTARIGGAPLLIRNDEIRRQHANDEPVRWSIHAPDSSAWEYVSPDETIVVVHSQSANSLLDDNDGKRAWLVHDAETGARLWTAKTSWDTSLAWSFDYAESPWIALTRADAVEILDARTGERVQLIRGLGPAWRTAPDEQSPTEFSIEHINAGPLTIRP